MKAREMTEIEKAWLAGFIDGEGSIGIYRKKSKHGRGGHDFGVRLLVVNTNQAAMDYVKALTGCGCSWISKKGYKANWKPCHRWQAFGENARDLVRQLLPYLRIKRAIAELVLTMPICSRGGRSPQDIAAQEILFAQAKVMNRRGLQEITK